MADVITRFKLETTQYDSKLRDASKGISEYARMAKNAGNEFQKFTQKNVEAARALGDIAVAAKNPKDKVKELVGAFNDAAKAYNNLTKEQQQSDWGQALADSVQKLKMRLGEAKKELYDIGDTSKTKFGELGNVINTLGSKLGITGNLTEMLTSKTALLTGAIGAMVTGVIAATKEWAAYNAELAKMDNATMVVTGLKGTDANEMTDAAKSLATVYNVDFRQAIEAANTLMSQFGESGDSAMKILRDGMQGMIQGDGGKLLSMIQQYAPAFHDAGVSASQLVAIIHNSEGGIFTDQNMQAIVMALPKIKVMSENTAKALAGIGIDGRKMAADVESGSMTVFDALQKISRAIDDNKDKTRETGVVMQEMFGRQARTAGDNLGKAIATLNTNLEETKRQTGELGESTAQLEQATERLNKAIRDCFGYDGWQTMATGIKSELVTAISLVVERVGEVKTFLTDTEVAGVNLFENVRTAALNSIGPLGKALDILLKINQAKNEYKGIESGASLGSALSSTLLGNGTTETAADDLMTDTTNRPKTPTKYITGGIKGVKEIATDIATTESMTALKAQLSGYQKDLAGATNTADYLSAEEGIKKTQEQIDAQPLAIRLGIDTDSAIQMQDDITAEVEKLDESLRDKFEPIKITADTKGLKAGTAEAIAASKEFQSAAGAISSIGTALQTIEDPAAKVMGIVAQAIATVALTFAKSLEKTFTPWDWIAAAAAGAATMISTISAIKSATDGGYAEGGIVPGNYFSGDMLRTRDYGIESGELILNRAQQNNIADQLTTGRGDSRGGAAQPFVTGQYIFLGTNNYLKSSGQGQLVTTSMLRAKGINI